MLVTKREVEQHYPERTNEEYEKQKRINNERKRARVRARSRQKLLGIGFGILGMIVSLSILIGYVNITKMRHEITELENQKIELQREKEGLIADLESVKSPAKVEEDALMKLGMDYPVKEQIVYLDVEELDFSEVGKVNIDTGDNFSIVKQFKNIFNSLLGMI